MARRKKTSQIKESEEKLGGIFDSSPDGIIVTGPDATVVECNQAALNMFGFHSKAEIIDKNGFDLAGNKDRDKLGGFFDNLLKQGAGLSRNIEFSFTNKNGQEISAEFSVSATKDSSGKTTGFVATVTLQFYP